MNKRIFLSPPWMGGDERKRVDEAFASNYIAPCGPMVDRFERDLAAAVGVPHACAVSSGTAALDLLFHELGVTRGDRVFCSDLTFVSSIAPAVHRGAEPVFIDCDEATWTMDPALLEEALADGARSGRLPKAVVAVDLYGQCCDYDRIEPLCARYGVPLIIDAAEALGAVYGSSEVLTCESAAVGSGSRQSVRGETINHRGHRDTEEASGEPSAVGGGSRQDNFRTLELSNSRTSPLRHAGDAGWAAVYSFNGNKIITTSGGGMVVSRDAGVVERARKRSQQSRESKVWYEHAELGYNYRMSNIVAAIGVGQLENLRRIVAKKWQIFDWYRQRLGNLQNVGFMPEAAYGRCTRWLTVITVGNGQSAVGSRGNYERPSDAAMRVIEALERENIESRPVWKPMHLQPVFRSVRIYGGSVSARLFSDGVCLPSGMGLEEADIGRVSVTINQTFHELCGRPKCD